MKTELSALDLHFLSQELQVVENGKIEKIYQWGKEDFIFKLFTPSGKKNLRIKLPGLMYFTDKPFKGPTLPPGYCSFLRKYLINAAIKKVYQKGFEKIFVIEFNSFKYGEMHLIIELLKPSNIILCKTEENKLIIMNPLDRHRFKDREIKGKAEYQFPPQQPNIRDLSEEKLIEILSLSDKPLVKSLAVDLGLGGIYSEEVLSRSNIKKETKVDSKILKKIALEIKNLLSEKTSPFVTGKEVFPIKMASKEKGESKETLSQAIDSIIPRIVIKEDASVDKEKKEETILSAQSKRLLQLEKEIIESQKAGEYIYEHYQEFETLLSKIKELRKTKSFKEIKSILKENKHFKELNEKEKKVIFEF